MNRQHINLFRFFFACIDLLALNFIHLVLMVLMQRLPNLNTPQYTLLFITTNMIWLCSAYFSGIYINDKHINFERFAKRTMQTFLLFVSLTLLFIFIYKFHYSRLFVLISFVSFGMILLTGRTIFICGIGYINNKKVSAKRS